MDNFFHNINKRLTDISARQDLAESAVSEIAHDTGKKLLSKSERSSLSRQAHAGKDIGKPGKMFKKVAADAARRYGSKEAGQRVAAAAMFKNAAKHESIGSTSGTLEEGHCPTCNCSPCECNNMEESAFQAAIGKKKYGDAGMKALQKAGREHASTKTMNKIRNKYDKYDEADNMSLEEDDMEEGNEFTGNRKAAIKAGKSTFTVGNKTYQVSGDTSDEKKMAEGAFKTQDIERQEREERKKQQRGLGQVPGVQDLKPGTKEHPLKNVAKGIKAFVQGKPEPMDEEKEPRSKGTAFDPETRKKIKTDREGTGKFDKKKISTGTVYTRRHDDDDDKDNEVKSDQPKKKGRPKGPAKGPERVTAKAWKHKGGRAVKEDDISIVNRGEYDQEGDEVKGDMHTVIRHARELEQHLKNGENLPTWVIEKVGQIKGMMTSISDYMLSQHERSAEQETGTEGIRIAEKAVSVKQRRAAGIAHAAQKGEIPKSELRGASKAMAKMPKGELHKFAATKEKGLPTKVKEAGKPDFLDLDKDGNKTEPMKQAAKQAKSKKREVEETTTSGSVAPVANSAPKGKGGMTFGKGVYEGAVNESYERKLSSVLNEGMNVTVNMNAEGQKSVNVSADGADAEKLAEILKLAGLGSQSGACDSCGTSPCGCDTVEEAYGDATATNNQPDWPTDRETTDANDPYLRRLSGGLNGPKSTGQTTVPVIAGQRRRMSTMEENVELERDLFKLYKNYKPQ